MFNLDSIFFTQPLLLLKFADPLHFQFSDSGVSIVYVIIVSSFNFKITIIFFLLIHLHHMALFHSFTNMGPDCFNMFCLYYGFLTGIQISHEDNKMSIRKALSFHILYVKFEYNYMIIPFFLSLDSTCKFSIVLTLLEFHVNISQDKCMLYVFI